jgi:hypothetical protein
LQRFEVQVGILHSIALRHPSISDGNESFKSGAKRAQTASALSAIGNRLAAISMLRTPISPGEIVTECENVI